MNLDLLFPLLLQETHLFHLCQGCRCVQVCPAPQDKLDNYFQEQLAAAKTPLGAEQHRVDALTAPSAVHFGNGKISVAAMLRLAIREHASVSSNENIFTVYTNISTLSNLRLIKMLVLSKYNDI